MRLQQCGLSAVLLLCTALTNTPAQAEDIFTELNAAYSATPIEETGSGNWHGLVGGAVIALQQPVADRRNYVLPLVAVSYRRTLYWHFGQLGAYVLSSHDRRSNCLTPDLHRHRQHQFACRSDVESASGARLVLVRRAGRHQTG